MSRVLFLVLDSLGIGALDDAERYGDAGSNTLAHIADWCAHPRDEGGRGEPLRMPNLVRLGLGRAAELVRGQPLPGLDAQVGPAARWGAMTELSTGKDTVSGHWELCGLPVEFEWGYFVEFVESFPEALVHDLAEAAGCDGLLGRCRASGTEIIQRLGQQHLETGWPIVYTSADSVVQIAAHEDTFGLERLYRLCADARRLVDPYQVGRVIARPFVGDTASGFRRTPHRRDFATPPTAPTLLDAVIRAGGEVLAVGKISDIFAGRGISESTKAHGLEGLMQASAEALSRCPSGGMVFTNLVDFDQEYGHRRDIPGYAAALEQFDQLLGAMLTTWRAGDLLVLSADHGNDPSWPGSDHTREHVPALLYAEGLVGGSVGIREGFCDVGQSIASWLGLPPLQRGADLLGDALVTPVRSA